MIGQYKKKLTLKGRLAIPKKIRVALGDEFIIAKWYEGCLVLVGKRDWQDLLQKITGTTVILTTSVRETDRFILGSAFEIKLDSQGRFVAPKSLREYAKLKDEVVFLGLGDRVEIWDLGNWLEKEKQVQSQAVKMVEDIAKKDWPPARRASGPEGGDEV